MAISDFNIRAAAAAATEAFFATLAAELPEIKTGDLDAQVTERFEREAYSAAALWVRANTPV